MIKAFVLAAAVALLAIAVVADKKEDVIKKSKQLMDKLRQEVIDELKKLKSEGKSYSAADAKTLLATISGEKFSKLIAEENTLFKELHEVQQSGELKDFKIDEQGSPEKTKEIEEALKELIKKDDLSPRFIGALLMGGTQVITDMVRVSMTRYTPVSQMTQ